MNIKLNQFKTLPKAGKLYLFSQFFRTLYFAWPIWYGFATQTIIPSQVGIFFSSLTILELVLEIPTGIVADKYSRKWSALIGCFINLFAPLLIYFAESFKLYIVAAFFYAIGRALLSGSLESLIYDHKDISKKDFKKINEFNITSTQLALVISSLLGGTLYSVHQSIPFLLETVSGIACILFISQINENLRINTSIEVASHTKYFIQGVKGLFSTRFLTIFLFVVLSYSAMLSLCVKFINEVAMIEYGIEPSIRGILMGGANAIALFILNVFLLKILKTNKLRIAFMTFSGVFVFSLLSINSVYIFVFTYIFWNLLSMSQTISVTPILHDNIASNYRSTALSAFYTLKNVIVLLASFCIGFIIEYYKTSRVAYLLFSIFLVLLVVPCTLWIMSGLKNNDKE